jgi:hypothetical protein
MVQVIAAAFNIVAAMIGQSLYDLKIKLVRKTGLELAAPTS